MQDEPKEATEWTPLIDITEVNPGSDNLIDVDVSNPASDNTWTHVRFNMFPDGGVARLNIYGEIIADQNWFLKGEPLDLAISRMAHDRLRVLTCFLAHQKMY